MLAPECLAPLVPRGEHRAAVRNRRGIVIGLIEADAIEAAPVEGWSVRPHAPVLAGAAGLICCGAGQALTGSLPGQRGNNVRGFGHETETALDVPQRRLEAEIRRGGGAAILDQDAAIAEKIGVGERVQHALIGVDAGERTVLGARDCAGCCRAACPKSR